MKNEILISIGIGAITICLIIMATLLILSQFTPSTFCENYCKESKGTFWMVTDCDGSSMGCAGACDIGNKTIYCEDLLKNITSMQS